MLEFGNFQVVEKTFTRKETAPRGQAFDGIKFRRYDSKKANDPGLVEIFVIADKAFEKLGLETYALTQANFGGQVYILVVDDQEEVEPVAKFVRQSTKKDGTKQKKGHSFGNEFLRNELIATGVLDAETHDNQYLALNDVTNAVAGLPSVVKAVYQIVKDETVDAEAEAANEAAEETVSDERNFN